MNKRLYVGNLPYTTTEEDLKKVFSVDGMVVESATIVTDKFSGRSKGFGFVEMATPEDAEKAIQKLNQSDMGGRNLSVSEARPREERSGSRGDFGGGGGFKKNFGGGY
ncbi:MAG: putative RNA-binding protein RbpA [Parcubacteria group bacterium LiPW_15]|nr:MAG: putative RNA-binding protein RbpA [Parcubacteria group bacterium LiPW_15]